MDDDALFCSGCGAALDRPAPNTEETSPVAPATSPTEAPVAPELPKAKVWPLVIGIFSMVLFVVIALQSCTAHVDDVFSGTINGELGYIAAFLHLAAGIILVATRRRNSRLLPFFLYLLAWIVCLGEQTSVFVDLYLWGIVSIVFALICLVASIRAGIRKMRSLWAE